MAIAVHLARQTPLVVLFMSDRCAVLEGLLQKLRWPVVWPQGTRPAAALRTNRATSVELEWTRTPIEVESRRQALCTNAPRPSLVLPLF